MNLNTLKKLNLAFIFIKLHQIKKVMTAWWPGYLKTIKYCIEHVLSSTK